MQDIKYVKEPGYIYNLFFVFTLYFNQDLYLKPRIGYEHAVSDCEYFRELIKMHSPIPNELLLFFCILDNRITLMTECYYLPYEKEFFGGKYNLDLVLEALSDYEQVIDNVLKFYFQSIGIKELKKYKNSLIDMNELIQNSPYSGDLKSVLYAFFINPKAIIQKLILELKTKESSMSQNYSMNHERILSLKNEMSLERVKRFQRYVKEKKVHIENANDMYFSICTYIRQVVLICHLHGKVLVICGYDCFDFLDYLSSDGTVIGLEGFGTAISEKNRLEILDFILLKQEVTIKEVEDQLGFTSANAYYHLSLMIKENMLNTRNQGRTVLYRINGEYFDKVRNALGKYVV